MQEMLERPDLADELMRLSRDGLAQHFLESIRSLTPVEAQGAWAAGVTYPRSKEARMVESEFSQARWRTRSL
jgi:hypothetical protein